MPAPGGLSSEIHGDGKLSLKEFCAFIMTLLRSNQNLLPLVIQVDVNKRGKIDGDEIKLLLAVM